MANQERILVIKLSALGDFIQALGPMLAIREHHPHAHITFMTTKPFKELAQKCGYFDSVWVAPKPKWKNLNGWFSLRKELNKAKYARIYDLQNNDRTGLYFKLLKNPKPEWVGIAKGASHSNDTKSRKSGTAFEGHKETLGKVGIQNIKIDKLEWMEQNLGQFNLPHKFALIIAGCAPNRPEKRWLPKYYASVAQHLIKSNITPVLIGTDAEKEINSEIARTEPEKIVNLTNKTNLYDIATLARRARLSIGNDTGPIHLAAATGSPVIVIFNESKSSNPKKHAPLGDKVHIVSAENIESILPKTVIEEIQNLI